ncbi:hypothetical protein [Bermanella sp. R86510]|uniref:hypothetical protein n=1 Tax=unclassified Bermanella TaxID=2627862 RepID=UPI0037CBB23A
MVNIKLFVLAVGLGAVLTIYGASARGFISLQEVMVCPILGQLGYYESSCRVESSIDDQLSDLSDLVGSLEVDSAELVNRIEKIASELQQLAEMRSKRRRLIEDLSAIVESGRDGQSGMTITDVARKYKGLYEQVCQRLSEVDNIDGAHSCTASAGG